MRPYWKVRLPDGIHARRGVLAAAIPAVVVGRVVTTGFQYQHVAACLGIELDERVVAGRVVLALVVAPAAAADFVIPGGGIDAVEVVAPHQGRAAAGRHHFDPVEVPSRGLREHPEVVGAGIERDRARHRRPVLPAARRGNREIPERNGAGVQVHRGRRAARTGHTQPYGVAAGRRDIEAVERQPFALGDPSDVAAAASVGRSLDIHVDVDIVRARAARVARGGVGRVVEALCLIDHRLCACRNEQEGDGTGERESAGCPFHKIPLKVVSDPYSIDMAVPGCGLAHGHTDVYQ